MFSILYIYFEIDMLSISYIICFVVYIQYVKYICIDVKQNFFIRSNNQKGVYFFILLFKRV